MRRLLLLLASPLLLVVALSSLMVGVSFYAESNPATFFVLTAAPATVQAQRVLYLLARAVLFPFQLGFIVPVSYTHLARDVIDDYPVFPVQFKHSHQILPFGHFMHL